MPTETDIRAALEEFAALAGDTCMGFDPARPRRRAMAIGLFPAPEQARPTAWARRLSRQRAALAGVAAIVILGGGLSVAAAAGAPVLPGAVVRALGWESTPGGYNADTATARRLLTISGPDGAPLTLWYSDANNHGYCVSLTSAIVKNPSGAAGVSAASEGAPQPGTAANGCDGPVGDQRWQQFGGAAFESANSTSLAFVVHVPGAASVRLRLADGSAPLLPIKDHWTAGWLTRQQAAGNPVLVGYSANGTEVATFDRAHFFSPWRP